MEFIWNVAPVINLALTWLFQVTSAVLDVSDMIKLHKKTSSISQII